MDRSISTSNDMASWKKATAQFRDAQHVMHIAQRIASAIGRRIDESSPMVDARLADGSRVNIIVAPLALNGGTISIRKFPTQNITLDTMVQQKEPIAGHGAVPRCRRPLPRQYLDLGRHRLRQDDTVECDYRAMFASDERIITIEDAVELRLQQPHVVQLESRPPNIEGVGQIAQRELLRNALRMRPDRIIVGEVRGSEAFRHAASDEYRP